jgi:formylglycine-generating enzyme required for sulfatase activity
MIRSCAASMPRRLSVAAVLSLTLAAATVVAQGPRDEDLRSEQGRKKADNWGSVQLSLSGPCEPATCQVQVDTITLKPFGPPPNDRVVMLDIGNPHLIAVFVNHEKVDSKMVTLSGRQRLIAEMKVPAGAPAPGRGAPASAPTGGTIVIAVDTRTRIRINDQVHDVVGEATFPMPFGEHYVRIDGTPESKQRAVRLTLDRPSAVLYFHAVAAPPPAVKPFGGDITWASVKGGSVELGCVEGDTNCRVDEKKHTANVRAFDIMTTEVTVGQFEEWLGKRPAGASAYERPDWSASIPVAELVVHPAVRVTWNEARDFCSDIKARLPKEDEWEAVLRQQYAGRIYAWDADADAYINDAPRAASGGPSQTGAPEPPAVLPGNFADKAAGRKFSEWSVLKSYDDHYSYTAPVGRFRPVSGVYDLIGNVWEWMDNDFQGRPGRKVLRGGSWTSPPPVTLRISHRLAGDPNKREDDVGFRCVK